MFRSITRLTVASALALTCSTAQAGLMKIGTADIEFARPIFGSTGKDTVKLNYLDRNNIKRSMRTNAGRFSGSATADGFDADVFYENADLVYLYCIDLYEGLAQAGMSPMTFTLWITMVRTPSKTMDTRSATSTEH